jgi:hypothetical protein
VITRLVYADLALASYTEPATIETPDIHALIKDVDGFTLVGLRGTNPAKFVDLGRDLLASQTRAESFLADAEQLAWRLVRRLTGPYGIGAHSKGGAEGQALAAIMTYLGKPPAALYTWGSPQMGKLGGLIATLPGADFARQHDPIPDEPRRGTPRPRVILPWPGPAPFNRIDCHAMQAYYDATALAA